MGIWASLRAEATCNQVMVLGMLCVTASVLIRHLFQKNAGVEGCLHPARYLYRIEFWGVSPLVSGNISLMKSTVRVLGGGLWCMV